MTDQTLECTLGPEKEEHYRRWITTLMNVAAVDAATLAGALGESEAEMTPGAVPPDWEARLELVSSEKEARFRRLAEPVHRKLREGGHGLDTSWIG